MAKRDLRGFAAGKRDGQKLANGQDAGMQAAMRTAKRLQGQSDEQLMAQLYQEVERGRRDGSFDAEAMQKFIAQVSPMLNEEQRQKLHQITNGLLSH